MDSMSRLSFAYGFADGAARTITKDLAPRAASSLLPGRSTSMLLRRDLAKQVMILMYEAALNCVMEAAFPPLTRPTIQVWHGAVEPGAVSIRNENEILHRICHRIDDVTFRLVLFFAPDPAMRISARAALRRWCARMKASEQMHPPAKRRSVRLEKQHHHEWLRSTALRSE